MTESSHTTNADARSFEHDRADIEARLRTRLAEVGHEPVARDFGCNATTVGRNINELEIVAKWLAALDVQIVISTTELVVSKKKYDSMAFFTHEATKNL